MRYLLDTNAVIALLNDPAGPVSRKLHSLSPTDIAISAVVLHELYFGAFKSTRRDHNLSVVEALRFQILELDMNDARHSGEIRAWLAARGTPIGPFDVLIAGQARARGMTLVSQNQREFARVPGLKTANWRPTAPR
jgi:tRNA(fMet)-specific endonuclease VapC